MTACLFERLFKVKKSGIFFFGISFFVLEIFTFLYYANEGRDDVIDRSTNRVQHSIKNISGNIKAMIFKLGTRNVHHKRKQNDSYYVATMATPLVPVYFCEKTNIPICNLSEWDRGVFL